MGIVKQLPFNELFAVHMWDSGDREDISVTVQ